MGRLLRRIRRFLTRYKRLLRRMDRLSDRISDLEEAQSATALEAKRLAERAENLEGELRALREQEAERATLPTYTARELLDEYLNGEHGDE